jgi:hypothetical protein
VCETENANACRAGEGVERRRLHFDRENPFATRRFNRFGGLPEGRVRCPAGPMTLSGQLWQVQPPPSSPSQDQLRQTQRAGRSDSLFPHPVTGQFEAVRAPAQVRTVNSDFAVVTTWPTPLA